MHIFKYFKDQFKPRKCKSSCIPRGWGKSSTTSGCFFFVRQRARLANGCLHQFAPSSTSPRLWRKGCPLRTWHTTTWTFTNVATSTCWRTLDFLTHVTRESRRSTLTDRWQLATSVMCVASDYGDDLQLVITGRGSQLMSLITDWRPRQGGGMTNTALEEEQQRITNTRSGSDSGHHLANETDNGV